MTTAYPLAWPTEWPRTPARDRVNGKGRWSHKPAGGGKPQPWTFDAARRALADELDAIGAKDVILSTNYDLRLDGKPRAGAKVPSDVGIAVYFTLKGRSLVMARDAFDRAEENMRSLSLAIRAMRSLEEHGGSLMMDKAFTGFAAIAPPKAWWDIIGCAPSASIDEINAAFRARAKELIGAPASQMVELNVARDNALAQRRRGE